MKLLQIDITEDGGLYKVSLIGHSNEAHVTSKRDVLNAIGEMMDSKCATNNCSCEGVKK